MKPGTNAISQDKNHTPVGLVESITIPIRAIAVQTSSGYGLAIGHPWESWGEVFWFKDRDHFTAAFHEAWYDQKAGCGNCALRASLRREAFKTEQVAVSELLRRSAARQ